MRSFLVLIIIFFYTNIIFAQHVEIYVSPAECITCSKNFLRLNSVEGPKFFVFGQRFEKDSVRVTRKIKPLLEYQSLIFSDSLETNYYKNIKNFNENIIVYNRAGFVQKKIHYNDLTEQVVIEINDILKEKLGKSYNYKLINGNKYEWNSELNYISIITPNGTKEFDVNVFEKSYLFKYIDSVAIGKLNKLYVKQQNTPFFVNIVSCNISDVGNVNLGIEYKTIKKDNEIETKLAVMQLNPDGALIDIKPIENYTGLIYKYMYVANDSLIYFVTNLDTNGSFKNDSLPKYIVETKLKHNKFEFNRFLPLSVAAINTELLGSNFLTTYQSSYPYFTSQFNPKIYNCETNTLINIIDDSSYNIAFEDCKNYLNNGKVNMFGCANYYYVLHSSYDNKNQNLYVVTHQNNNKYLKVFKHNTLVANFNLAHYVPKVNEHRYRFSFDFELQKIHCLNADFNSEIALPIYLFNLKHT